MNSGGKSGQHGIGPSRRDLLRASFGVAAFSALGGTSTEGSITDYNLVEDRTSITDVLGIMVGHHTYASRPTGCTVVIAEDGAVGGVDVRGASPGTRETDLLDPLNLVQQVHAVLLSGGSAFGLDAATGVMKYLEEKGIGFPTGAGRVPIVPAAILYDLGIGNPKIRPDAAAGYSACKAASNKLPAEGNAGAGAGATVGKLFGLGRSMKGGIGTAAITIRNPENGLSLTVGAIIAVNAVGDVIDPSSGAVIAGLRSIDGHSMTGTINSILRGDKLPASLGGIATTIGVVATDAVLDKAQAGKVAQMAHDGLARTINPVHTAYDGDTIFALATGRSSWSPNVTLIGALGAEAVARAVMRAVRAARSIPGIPSASDLAISGPAKKKQGPHR